MISHFFTAPPHRGEGSPMAIASQRISLRRIQRLTSVAFGATSFPRKEANDLRLCRCWNPDISNPKPQN